jgi:hypothetical protein
MKITSTFNNFARGRIDHDMVGRFDLPIYSSGYDIFKNFVTNFKGNAIYRSGFKNILAFQDCALIEFKFSQNQNYILVLYNTKMRFLSYDSGGTFGWVLDGSSNILEIDTPWTLAQSKEISFKQATTQNFDTMIMTHGSHEPRKLIRNAANSFTLRTYGRKDDPFPLTWQASKTITAITRATNALITTSAAHGYSVGDRIKISAVAGMTEINGWTAAVLTTPTSTTFTIDLDTTSFTAYSSAGATEKVLTSDYPSSCLFYKGRLYYSRRTTVFASEAAEYFIHTLPATVIDSSALQFTIADIAQNIGWFYAGDNSLIAGAGDGIVAINGGGVGSPITAATVEASLTSADGASETSPIRKSGFIFYVSLNQRNLNFFNYDLLTETFQSQDANVAALDLTTSGLQKIKRKKDRNDLIYLLRGDGALCSLNFNKSENIIGWHEHYTRGSFKDIAVITDNDGNEQLFALTLRNSVYYIEQLADYVEFKSRNDFIGTNKNDDEEAYRRYTAEQLNECIFLDNATIFSDLRSATITYNSAAGTITATTSSFSAGNVGKHISYKTATGYESGRFLITGYTSATVVTVSVLQTPTANTSSSWYLTFNTATGLSRFNGLEVGVVTAGGFLKTETVSGGVIDLGDQVITAAVGYTYAGVIKSFPLGYQIQAVNTQSTVKAISRVGLRAVSSVGGKFGSDIYRLEPIQEIKPNSLNYLPPPVIDGTQYIVYSDDSEIDQCFYMVQEEPGPMHIAALIIDVSHSSAR